VVARGTGGGLKLDDWLYYWGWRAKKYEERGREWSIIPKIFLKPIKNKYIY
jgi:hypothetical protein